MSENTINLKTTEELKKIHSSMFLQLNGLTVREAILILDWIKDDLKENSIVNFNPIH